MPHSELHKKKRKKNWAILAALVVFIAIIWTISIIKIANAQEPSKEAEVIQCGKAVGGAENIRDDSTSDFCDIYQRRIEFHNEQKKFRAEIEKRRKRYEIPGSIARKNYEGALEAHHAEAGR